MHIWIKKNANILLFSFIIYIINKKIYEIYINQLTIILNFFNFGSCLKIIIYKKILNKLSFKISKKNLLNKYLY